MSVIVPHRDDFERLERALSSIPRRRDVEVIVVDDCSLERRLGDTASSPAFDHVQFHSLDRQRGAGAARNHGLDHARGSHVLFLDSDDWFDEMAFKLFLECASEDYDLVTFRCDSYFENGDQGHRHEYLLPIYELDERTLQLSIEQPVAKLISRRVLDLQDIRFSEVPVGNDILFSTKLALRVRKSRFIDQVVYHIADRVGSISTLATDRDQEIRLGERRRRVEEIRASWGWFAARRFLARRNALAMCNELDQVTGTPELQTAISNYRKALPASSRVIWNVLQVMSQARLRLSQRS